MKNVFLVFLAVLNIMTTFGAEQMKQQLETQAERYENRLEIQQSKYEDEIIDLKQKLYGKTFELDMATNHIELLNAENGASE